MSAALLPEQPEAQVYRQPEYEYEQQRYEEVVEEAYVECAGGVLGLLAAQPPLVCEGGIPLYAGAGDEV